MKIPEVLLSEEAILDIEYLADLFLKKHGASAALSFIDQFVCRCHIMVDESKIHTLSPDFGEDICYANLVINGDIYKYSVWIIFSKIGSDIKIAKVTSFYRKECSGLGCADRVRAKKIRDFYGW